MRKWSIVFLSILLLGGMMSTGSILADERKMPRGDSVNVKMMSYNIHHAEGEDGVLDLGRIAQVINDSEAEIIGLQEVDNHWSSRSDFQDQAKLLAEKLDMHYTYAANLDYESSEEGAPNRQYGTAILSKYPILKAENHFLSKIGNTEQRGLLEATINVKGTHVNVYNTHLALTSEERKMQINEIIDIASKSKGPKVITGDLNAEPGSVEMKPMYKHYNDVFAGTNEAYTYSAANPSKRIDYIFASNDLKTKNPVVVETLASDHLPITSEIVIEGTEPYENGK